MKFTNRKQDLEIYVQTMPGNKRPSLLIGDELGYKKVAAFLSDGDAEDFIEHMKKFCEVKNE